MTPGETSITERAARIKTDADLIYFCTVRVESMYGTKRTAIAEIDILQSGT